MYKLTFIFLICLTFLSCKKDEELAVAGVTEVEIIILNPLQDELISGNTELTIDGRIEANALMNGWSVIIRNTESGQVLDEFTDICQQTMYTIHHHWTPNLPSGTPIEMQIIALGQNETTLAEKSIRVTIQ